MMQINFSDMSFNSAKEYVDNLKEQYINNDLTQQQMIETAAVLELDTRKNIQSLGGKLRNYVDARNREIERVKGMYNFDLQFAPGALIAGVDEVGRGPLAGPIVGAAVVLDLNVINDRNLLLGIKDSKKLSSRLREELAQIIKSKAVCWSISMLDNNMIDTKGIAWCNNEIFRRAVQDLSKQPAMVLTDGYPIKNFSLPNKYIIKGDAKSASIACASIIAKVYRDELMKEYAKIYPGYGFEDNAGYGTQEHIAALKTQGVCSIHRRSFLTNILSL